MAYHFPLMPRMFMALRQEERHPIIEIMKQTPSIPETCQWAIFLRNHDELTLEMVTDEERDYMYSQYAADPQMRVNVGIRRRLAPLMEFSRPRIELMNSLLFSMPGTPIIYYGDEIAMSDNVFLGDRNGVRTPMQWSPDRNGGFSRCDPSRLFLPANQDTVGGYEAVNVEAEDRSPFSLLNWMKRMVALRRSHTVFGRGSLEFIGSSNRKVLSYLRRDEHETVLCVANLARTVQPIELHLGEFAGLTPVEMLGQTRFPRVGELPYFLTLAPYGFYWFQLQDLGDDGAAAVHDEQTAEVPSILVGVVWDSLLDSAMRAIIERDALPRFLARQRWFGGKARQLTGARFADWASLRAGAQPAFVTIVEATYADGGREQYVVPLVMLDVDKGVAAERDHPDSVLALVAGARKGVLCDGLVDDATCATLAASMLESRVVNTRSALLRGADLGLPALPDASRLTAEPITRLALEQSNTSVRFGQRAIMKVFRRLTPGANPDVEVGRFLTARGFARVPKLEGALEYAGGVEVPASVAMLQAYVPHQGTGWDTTLDELSRYFERVVNLRLPRPSREEDAQRWIRGSRRMPPASVLEAIGTFVPVAEMLGRRTGELHGQLGAGGADEPAFAPEPFDAAAGREAAEAMRQHATRQFDLLNVALGHLDATRYELANLVLAERETLLAPLGALAALTDGGRRIRCHGDYHLGQVLVSEGDVVILDFEGEPARPLVERRAKTSPMRDVAGMLRSFSYAAATGLSAATAHRPEDRDRLAPWSDLWERWVSAVFLRAYLQATRGDAFMPPSPEALGALLDAYLLDKALYELGYELNNRPDWVRVPLDALARRLGRT
jgi:maltose alpha-D-glucosyltransferase/alpha-amylase